MDFKGIRTACLFGLIFGVCSNAFAWPTPTPRSQYIASQDLLAASSDSHNVGTSGNIWQSSFVRNTRLAYRAESPSVVASFGTVFASTDGNLYFRNAAGSQEKLTSL